MKKVKYAFVLLSILLATVSISRAMVLGTLPAMEQEERSEYPVAAVHGNVDPEESGDSSGSEDGIDSNKSYLEEYQARLDSTVSEWRYEEDRSQGLLHNLLAVSRSLDFYDGNQQKWVKTDMPPDCVAQADKMLFDHIDSQFCGGNIGPNEFDSKSGNTVLACLIKLCPADEDDIHGTVDLLIKEDARLDNIDSQSHSLYDLLEQDTLTAEQYNLLCQIPAIDKHIDKCIKEKQKKKQLKIYLAKLEQEMKTAKPKVRRVKPQGPAIVDIVEDTYSARTEMDCVAV